MFSKHINKHKNMTCSGVVKQQEVSERRHKQESHKNEDSCTQNYKHDIITISHGVSLSH